MPRPQRELDPGGGPLVEFARELRALRARAGDPKFAAMSRRTGRSKTALADAVSGRHLARWETVEDFVRACEADPRPWRSRWEQARAAQPEPEPEPEPEPGPVAEPEPVSAPGSPAQASSAAEQPEQLEPEQAAAVPVPRRGDRGSSDIRASRSSRRPFVLGVGLGLLVGVVLGALVVASGTGVTEDPFAASSLQALTVQNKVALGPSSLVEDRTPAYLSSVPIAYCATPSRSCKVSGTEMSSGVALVANCQTEGQQMANFNRSEAASQDNPDRADSSLWYRVSFPDGRSGYLSEVYVIDDNRGGMDLPSCGPGPTVVGAQPRPGG